MRGAWSALIALSLATAGCFYSAESYPPPVQGEIPPGEDALLPFIQANEAEAVLHFESDISPQLESGAWRWTWAKPSYVFQLPDRGPWKFRLEFVLPDVVFEHTGPVAMTVKVNGKPLVSQRLTQPGKHFYEQPVPDGVIDPSRAVAVEAALDRIYPAPGDGKPLGYLLLAAGFVR